MLASLERHVNAGSVGFTPNDKALAAIMLDQPGQWSVHFSDVAAGREVCRLLKVGRGGPFVISPDGTRLAVAGEGAQVWDLRRSRRAWDFRFDRTIDDAGGWRSRRTASCRRRPGSPTMA